MLDLWVSPKVLKTIKNVLTSGCRHPSALRRAEIPDRLKCTRQAVIAKLNDTWPILTSGTPTDRMFVADPRTWQPNFQPFWGSSPVSASEPALPVSPSGSILCCDTLCCGRSRLIIASKSIVIYRHERLQVPPPSLLLWADWPALAELRPRPIKSAKRIWDCFSENIVSTVHGAN